MPVHTIDFFLYWICIKIISLDVKHPTSIYSIMNCLSSVIGKRYHRKTVDPRVYPRSYETTHSFSLLAPNDFKVFAFPILLQKRNVRTIFTFFPTKPVLCVRVNIVLCLLILIWYFVFFLILTLFYIFYS